jgi:hypothetical protein
MALAAATGDFFIMGNDDVLTDEKVIADIVYALETAGRPEVAMWNVHDGITSSEPLKRCPFTGVVGAGPETALKIFRSLSIVTGHSSAGRAT